MAEKRFHDWIGLSGVDADENPSALLWSKRLELPLLLVALWILISWYWESITLQAQVYSTALNWGIWGFFVLETTLLTSLVHDKANYLKNNWLNLLIILCGLPILWANLPYMAALRSLRLLIFLSLMLQLSATIRHVLARNHLGATLLVSAVFIIVAGYLIAGIDPGITTPADGIWWAWVTVTTVGYGDIVPSSAEGRILAGILILLGVGLFSLITASFSVFFISQSKLEPEQQRLKNIEQQLSQLEQKLTDIQDRLPK